MANIGLLLVTNKNKLLNVTVSKITSANARHGQTVSVKRNSTAKNDSWTFQNQGKSIVLKVTSSVTHFQ